MVLDIGHYPEASKIILLVPAHRSEKLFSLKIIYYSISRMARDVLEGSYAINT